MDVKIVLALVRARLGITSNVRDAYLTAIIEGVIQDLMTRQGVQLYTSDKGHLMFVVDYATWRYQSRDSNAGMPRHLQLRLHNLFIKGDGRD